MTSQDWAGALYTALEKDKEKIIFDHLPDVLSSSYDPHVQYAWLLIQSWEPARQSQLFIKHSLVDPRAKAIVKSWPLDEQLHFLLYCGQVTDILEIVSGWPHKAQQKYYDKHPPQYDAVVDKAVLEDEHRFLLYKDISRDPKMLATRAFLMAKYTMPDFCPPSCGDAPAGIALPIGFHVYTTFHGVHERMNPVWFADIMRTVITRLQAAHE